MDTDFNLEILRPDKSTSDLLLFELKSKFQN